MARLNPATLVLCLGLMAAVSAPPSLGAADRGVGRFDHPPATLEANGLPEHVLLCGQFALTGFIDGPAKQVIIRDMAAGREEFFKVGDPVFQAGWLGSISRTGVKILSSDEQEFFLPLSGPCLSEIERGNPADGAGGIGTDQAWIPYPPEFMADPVRSGGRAALERRLLPEEPKEDLLSELAGPASSYAAVSDVEQIPWGVVVYDVDPGSVLGAMHIESGDVIYKVEDRDIRDDVSLTYQLCSRRTQDSFHVTVLRQGQPLLLEVETTE